MAFSLLALSVGGIPAAAEPTVTVMSLESATPVNGGVALAYTAPSVPTGSTITSYDFELSTDGGAHTAAGPYNTANYVGSPPDNTTALDDPFVDPNGPGVCGQNNPCSYRIRAEIGPNTWQTPWSDWVAIGTFTAPSLNHSSWVDGGVALAYTAPSVPTGSTITSYDYELSTDGGAHTAAGPYNTANYVGSPPDNTTALDDPFVDPNGPGVCGQNNPCSYRIRAEIGPNTWQTPWSNWASTADDTFTVTYDGNGATSGTVPVDSAGPYVPGATVTAAANTGSLARDGFTFSGWNTAANGSGTAHAATGSATFTMPAANVTLYAQWTSNTHTVTYDGNGATSGTVPVDANSPYETGATVTVAANTGTLARDGYDFDGWNTAANGSGTAHAATGSATFTMPAHDVVLYAQWTPVTHTVSFDANGGSGSMADEVHSAPAALTANSFTRSGFDFSGWNTAANGSGTSYADQAVYPFDVDATLYAQWTSNTHTVTYDGNGATSGTVPVDANSPYETGATVTVAANTGTLVRDGFTFAGWNTAADGSGTAYAATGSATFTMPAANVVLYAQWTPTAHTVSFDANGGSGSMGDQVDNTPTALTPNSFTRSGYDFTGWNTAANGSGASYADQAVYPFDADTTLFAQWAPTAHTVSFDANGGSGSMGDQVDNTPTALTPNSFIRSGYDFTGWNTADDGSGTSYADQAVYAFDADTTLYAQWTLSGLTSRDRLLAVIADLQQNCPGPPCRDAIKHLTEAVASYTADGTELKVPGGEKFFDKLKEAADKLRKVKNNAAAARAPDTLWDIAKQLVEDALNKATALGGRQNEINAATHELGEATKRWPMHLHGAFEHLKKSWQHSQKALK